MKWDGATDAILSSSRALHSEGGAEPTGYTDVG